MSAEKKVLVEDVLPLVGQFNGNVAAIARTLKVSRKTVHRRIEESTTLQDAISDARETMLDEAEKVLYDRALEGHTAELLFYLKTQGKSRGYVERQEMTGKDGGPIEIRKPIEFTDEELALIAAEGQ